MLDARPRFVAAPDAAAMLDRSTGLGWERQPALVAVSFAVARAAPPGWRLPSATELLLLLSGLPVGHPFPEPAPGALFWSATESPYSARGEVRAIDCRSGPRYVVRLLDRDATARVWRVLATP